MVITANMKKWLIENCDVSKDASDDEFRQAAGVAMANGDLSVEKFTELSKDPKEEEANEFADKLNTIADNLGKLTTLLTPKEKEEVEEKGTENKGKEDKKEKEPPKEKVQPTQIEKMVASMGGTPIEPDEKDINVRVKEAAEQYSMTKSAMTYPEQTNGGRKHFLAGQRAMTYEGGRPLDTPSELDKAVAGAYAKLMILTSQRGSSRKFGFQALRQHEQELLFYAAENMKWAGASDGGDYADIKDRKLTLNEQKAIFDEAGASQGLEAVPIVFDDQVIQTPLLHGELFPLTNRVPIDRGSRIEGVSVGKVEGTWTTGEATPITLFNTTAYVTAFDTTIFRWSGSIQVGLDFMSDTPIDFGQLITAQYGERLLEDLDDVIADGDGATRPEGVMTGAGAGTAWGGVTSIGNYETLRFGVAKPELQGAFNRTAVFCGTETSYQRAKALPVATADARRLFAGASTNVGTYDDYSLMGRPYKINETLDNTDVFFAVLGRYRMYVRRGLTIATSREGDTLQRGNLLLITATARYGGQMERAAAAVQVTSAPA